MSDESVSASTEEEGGGILQWFFDLLASIFGGGDDGDERVTAAVIETYSEAVTLAEVLPVTGELSEEHEPWAEDAEDDWTEAEFAL